MQYDFFELNDELENQKQAILAEAEEMEAYAMAIEAVCSELIGMADMIEAHDIDKAFADLVAMARIAERENPISKEALQLKAEMAKALKEIA